MKSLIFIFSILAAQQLYSQTIVKATVQGWAGGVYCVSGSNYSATILLATSPKEISVNGVYLQNSGKMEGTIVSENETPDGMFINVKFGTRVDEYDAYDNINKEKIVPIEYKSFEGAAFIELNIDGTTVDVIVEQFEMLEFLAYP